MTIADSCYSTDFQQTEGQSAISVQRKFW